MADAEPTSIEARYEGEDVRPTSVRELRAWYIYGWAAEVFVVCGIGRSSKYQAKAGTFIPITLEQLARENGVLLSDHTTPCVAQPVDLPNGNTTFTRQENATQNVSIAAEQCIIRFLGLDLNTASFAMYTFSLSVLIQALVLISISAAADHGRYRKTFLVGFAFLGSVATMLFLPIGPKAYWIAPVLAIVSNMSIGSSFVLLNSFLPLLVRHHPSVNTMQSEGDPEEASIDSTAALLPGNEADSTVPNPKSKAAPSPELQLSTKISSNGIGIGYIAAAIVQVISVLIVFATHGSTFSLRLVLFFVGAWWFVFTIPTALWLRPRPGPPLHMGKGKTSHLHYLVFAWKALGKTIMRARRLSDVLLFLAAWFLLSDAIATVSGTAVLFAKTTLGMKPASLAMINVVTMLAGVVGALSWSRASRALGLQPSHTILCCLCVFELIPLYALLGYIPAIKRAGNFGLQQPWEMYPLAAVYGLILGGLSSYCRALFGELVPPGFEAAFFALYAVTDKGSSIFGPAIVGAIIDGTGDIRPAFFFLAILIGLPVPLMYFVNVDRGKKAAFVLSQELEGVDSETR